MGYDFNPKEEYDKFLRKSYVTNTYNIRQEQFDEYKSKIMERKMTTSQVCYQTFYNRWGCFYSQYIRIVKTIINYIKINRANFPDTDYISIFRSYMSIDEQRFLNYHASIDQEFADILHGTILEEEISNNAK